MRVDTNEHHDMVAKLGITMGFDAFREWSPSLTDGAYVPRIDVLWCQRLSGAQVEALETVGARAPRDGDLPIAAWEIEGSDASTKGMGANLANLRVTEAPFSFLAVRGGTKDNLYERALCVAKTQRHYFGCQAAVPLDTRWLLDLAALPLSREKVSLPGKRVRGGGGEGDWAEVVRASLRQRGTLAGFGVTESSRSLLSPADGFTEHQIDLIWTLPMPKGLRTLLEAIGDHDSRLSREHLILDRRYDQVTIAAFEIENSRSKHGFGGLLALAAHGVNGVFVAGDRTCAKNAAAALATYRRFMRLHHVSVYDGHAR